MAEPLTISLVVAVAENGVIGLKGDLPWRIRADLKTFRRITMGKPLLMGRKTFQSLKKPLDGRDNIVLTRHADFTAPANIFVTNALDEALAVARKCAELRGVNEVMCIGGADIFRALLPLATRIYYTRVLGSPPGDTFFPDFDRARWRCISSEPLPPMEGDDFAGILDVLEPQSAGELAV